MDDEKLNNKKANLTVNYQRGSRTIIISNEGPATARNVRVDMLESNTTLMEGDIKMEFPCDLKKGKSVTLKTTVGHNTSQQIVRLIWNDDSRNDYEKDYTYLK